MYKLYRGYCLAADDPSLFPVEATPCDGPRTPLVFLVKHDPLISRGFYAISDLSQLREQGVECLLPAEKATGELADFVRANGASVLNVSFQNAFRFLTNCHKKDAYRVTLVGLGDVGGTVLTALKLLGRELSKIRIFDPYTPLIARYEMELNQVLSPDGSPMPKIIPCGEDDLFDCDLFLFTASRGIPPVGSDVKDVRMVQYEANRDMLRSYAQRARNARFNGLFCQISDPVDHLSRAVFLQSNQDESGAYDFAGLLPEQVQGFGLGVMAARAAYYAEKEGLDLQALRAYGPHGQDLIVANDCGDGYDAALSAHLTELTRTANLCVRDLGFKPYIAPGLSSAGVSILRLLRGREHFGAIPMDGAYFGCVSRYTAQGISVKREAITPALFAELQRVHRTLKEFDYHV